MTEPPFLAASTRNYSASWPSPQERTPTSTWQRWQPSLPWWSTWSAWSWSWSTSINVMINSHHYHDDQHDQYNDQQTSSQWWSTSTSARHHCGPGLCDILSFEEQFPGPSHRSKIRLRLSCSFPWQPLYNTTGLHKLWYVLISWADRGSCAHKCVC